jgi:Fe2+ or Zn2+ uptake regulation protein
MKTPSKIICNKNYKNAAMLKLTALFKSKPRKLTPSRRPVLDYLMTKPHEDDQ